MATQLFFRSGQTGDTRRPGIHFGTNNANLIGSTVGWEPELLWTSRGSSGSALISSASTVAGTTPGVEVAGGRAKEWITPPIDQDVTISGTVTINLWASESNMSANVAINVVVQRIDPQGGIVSTILTTTRTTEVAVTTRAVNNFTATPTSTNLTKGDRIRVRVFGDDAGTMNAGFTFDFGYARSSAAVDGDSYIQFNETFGFLSTEPAGTQLFLTTTTGPAVGAAEEREMWTSRGAGATNAVTNTFAGWAAPSQITATAGGTAIEWYSKQLSAFTLASLVRLNIRVLVSNTLCNTSIRAELAVCNADGSGASIWAAASLTDVDAPGASGSGTGTNSSGLPQTSENAIRSYIAGPDTSVTDGQRLRLRLFIDDESTDAAASGFTATVVYAGTSDGASGDSFITLSQSVTEFSPQPTKPHVLTHAVHRSYNW